MIPAYDSGNTAAGGFSPGDVFDMDVTYTWYGSPFHEYTIKVYSKFDTNLIKFDANGDIGPSIFYTDGINEPSEFTGNPYDLGNMVADWELPECAFCGTCTYCENDEGGCPAVSTVPAEFVGHLALIEPPLLAAAAA